MNIMIYGIFHDTGGRNGGCAPLMIIVHVVFPNVAVVGLVE